MILKRTARTLRWRRVLSRSRPLSPARSRKAAAT